MAVVTQIEIDEATLIAKTATYKLAAELAVEQKYGGNIDCCIKKLKMLWILTRRISCMNGSVLTVEGVNCLSDEKIKRLILKIKQLCS